MKLIFLFSIHFLTTWECRFAVILYFYKTWYNKYLKYFEHTFNKINLSICHKLKIWTRIFRKKKFLKTLFLHYKLFFIFGQPSLVPTTIHNYLLLRPTYHILKVLTNESGKNYIDTILLLIRILYLWFFMLYISIPNR